MINVTVWSEYRHEKTEDYVRAIYPGGLHAAIGKALEEDGDIKVTLATLDDPEQGLPDSVLNNTDVLFWWGHLAHGEVSDELVARIVRRVYGGMGFVALHSGHHSKPFKAIVGTTGNLLWGATKPEVIWNINPTHPIAKGIPSHFKLESEEIYAEPFQIPEPDELVFLSWYETGYAFRGGCCWKRGAGKVFYFQPGHESVPTYHNSTVQQILRNAAHWAAPAETGYAVVDGCPCIGEDFVCDGEIPGLMK